MERQAKDGTFYQQVGPDEWQPIVRAAKDGTKFRKVGADDWAPIQAPQSQAPEGASGLEKAYAGLEGFADSASLGTLPYLKAGVAYAGDQVMDAFGGPEATDSYGDLVKQAKAQGSEVQEKAPGYAMGGQVAGFFVPGAGAAKVVGKSAQALAKGSKVAKAISKAGRAKKLYDMASKAKLAGKTAQAAKFMKAARADLLAQGGKLAAEGALLGAAYTPESGFSDAGARVESAAVGAATGFAVPFAMRGAGKAITGSKKALAAAGKKLLSTTGGVSEDVIERYLKNPERIRGAETFDDLYEQVTGIVGEMADDLDNSKVDYAAAKNQLDEVAQSIKNSRIEGKEKALEEVKRASHLLDESVKIAKQNIAEKASPLRAESLVDEALHGQKDRVTKGSKKAFEMLDELKAKKMIKVFHGTFADFSPEDIKWSKKGNLGRGVYVAKDKIATYNYGDNTLEYGIEKGKKFFEGANEKGYKQVKKIIEKYGLPEMEAPSKYSSPWGSLKDSIKEHARNKGKENFYGADKVAQKILKAEGYSGIKGFQNNREMLNIFSPKDLLPPKSGVLPLRGLLTKPKTHLKFLGKKKSEAAKSGQKILSKYVDDIEKQIDAGEFDGPAIKRTIQDLDSDVKSWELQTGSFDDERNKALKILRSSLDKKLKTISPKYKEQMAKVSEDAGLLGKASKEFGKRETRLSKLQNIGRPSAKYQLKTLKELANKSGGELSGEVDKMVDAQRTLKSKIKMENLTQKLPAQKDLRKAQMEAALAKRMAKPRSVKDSIKNSAANYNALSAKAKMETAKETFKKFKAFGEAGAQSRLKQVARGKIYAEKQLRELSKLADKDFVDAVKAAGDAEAFTKTAFNGSRNVNLWTALGLLASGTVKTGAAVGGITAGPAGIAIGASIGALVDVFGPKVTKKILDGVIKIRGPVTVKAINQMNLPNNAKVHLIDAFKGSVLAARASSAAKNVPKAAEKEEKEKPKKQLKGKDKWANNGIDKLLQHAASASEVEIIKDLETLAKKDNKAKNLLIQSSGLKPGSKAMSKKLEQIKKKVGGDS